MTAARDSEPSMKPTRSSFAVTAAKKSTKDGSRAEHHERVYQAEVRVGEKLKAEYADKVIQEAIRKNKKAFYKFARKTGARS